MKRIAAFMLVLVLMATATGCRALNLVNQIQSDDFAESLGSKMEDFASQLEDIEFYVDEYTIQADRINGYMSNDFLNYLEGGYTDAEINEKAAGYAEDFKENLREALDAQGLSTAEIEEIEAVIGEFIDSKLESVLSITQKAKPLYELKDGGDAAAFAKALTQIMDILKMTDEVIVLYQEGREKAQTLQQKYGDRLPQGYLLSLAGSKEASVDIDFSDLLG